MSFLTLLITPHIVIWLLTRSRRAFRWVLLTALLTIQIFSLLPLLIIGIVVLRQPQPVAGLAMAKLYRDYRIVNPELHGAATFLGIDIAAGCGEPIYAPFAGTVTENHIDHQGNTILTIESSPYVLTLAHGDYLVEVGDVVEAGQMVGTENLHGYFVGAAPICHSHVILKENGRFLNYLEWEPGKVVLASADIAQGLSGYAEMVHRIVAETETSVEPELVMGIIQQESAWNSQATSSAGAMGLMQLMPGTATDMGVVNAYDPEQNIRGGVKYITWLMSRYNGDMRRAVMAYHAGPGNLENRGPTSLDIYYANQVMGYYEGYLNE